MDILNALNWRYATKKMSGEPVSQELVDQIIEAAYLAPTSSGLQPFQIISISNKELREKIQPIAYGQSQIIDGSHVLVFASWDKYTAERIDFIYDHMNAERGLPSEATADYVQTLKDTFLNLPEEAQATHAAKQAYIAFGIALTTAAVLGVDATPMEGFVNADLDKLLGLEEKGLKSAVILTLGHRATEGDWLQGMKKVRHPKEIFLTEIK